MASTKKRQSAKIPTRKSGKSAVRKAADLGSTSKAALPPTGPVTLAEAKALVLATKQPTRIAKTRGKAAIAVGTPEIAIPATSTPAAVGVERERLQRQRREEREQRARDYEAVMAVMKKRGARRAHPKDGPRGKTRSKRTDSFAPLQIVAEGDSWFDYPVPFFGGGIIPRLEDRLGVPILNLASAGDEVRYMLGVEERTRLVRTLSGGCPAGGPWDVLLFSGGGNDIVDNPMALWIKDWTPGTTPADHIHTERFATVLALVRAGYEDLIALRDVLSPTTHLVFQGYDYAIPDGRGICHLGPWLKPTFDLRKFPNQAAAAEVVKAMLQQFAAMLSELVEDPKVQNVTFINGQGTLPRQKGSWHNELHPSRDGFEKFADLFYKKLKELFPGRVA
jgi:hypothetical protein